MYIYIGNMSSDTTVEQIRHAFEGFGEVSAVRIIKDQDNGRPKGFAFIDMPLASEAKAAIGGLHGYELNGRALTVSAAKTKPDTGNRSGNNISRKPY